VRDFEKEAYELAKATLEAELEKKRRVWVHPYEAGGHAVAGHWRLLEGEGGDTRPKRPKRDEHEVIDGITPKKGVYDVGSDVVKAAKLLGLGHHVELSQPREVSTLVSKLAEMVEDAKKKGKDAPIYDLCKVSVKKTNLFCVKTKGVPRVRMPQLKGEPLKGSRADALERDKRGEVDLTEKFADHLREQGFSIKRTKERADYLRATQDQLNGASVAAIAKYLEGGGKIEGALLVARDNYIVDGHHRWAAEVAVDAEDGNLKNDPPLDVLRIDAPIIQILDLANKFAADWGIPQQSVASAIPDVAGIPKKDISWTYQLAREEILKRLDEDCDCGCG
jgi:hypothetical protein